MDSERTLPHTYLPYVRGNVMPTVRAPAQLSRAAPIVCPQCGGRAPLIRMSPDGFSRGKAEIWTYECSACWHKVEKTVENGGTPG